MEIKSLVHFMTWLVVDGVVAVGVLKVLMGVLGNGTLAEAIRLMSQALCG